MPTRIAIPVPTSKDEEYNARTFPKYLGALKAAGVEPVTVPLHEPQDRVAKLLAGVQGMLLPGSRYDIDPQRYGEARQTECADDDPARTAVDELLLQDAFNLRKPMLAICLGAQNLNVWRNGSLVQHLTTSVNHSPGRTVAEAHAVRLELDSKLAAIRGADGPAEPLVNSSHHQAIRIPGDKLLITAVSSSDDVIEGIELDSPDHFVVGVQWHPERTYSVSAFSRSLFAALAREAEAWRAPEVESLAKAGS